MHLMKWKDSISRKIDHEKALVRQYLDYCNNKIKPKIVVGRKYRTKFPEMYKLTNPKAKDWNPSTTYLNSKEKTIDDVSKEKKK